MTDSQGQVLDEERRCPDCDVAAGAEHEDGCDVARCLRYGSQRLLCGRGSRLVPLDILPGGGVDVIHVFDGHDRDVWTGTWPGQAECEEFGWWAVFVPYGNPSWQPVPAGTPDARPDLSRLVTDARWSSEARRWVR